METATRPHRRAAIASLACTALVPTTFALMPLALNPPHALEDHASGSLGWFLALVLVAIVALLTGMFLALAAVVGRLRAPILSIVAAVASGLTVTALVVFVLNFVTFTPPSLF